MSHVLIACQVLLALVFGASALGKVRGRTAFDGFVSAVRRLGPRWAVGGLSGVRALAAGLVAAEAATAVLLLVPSLAWAGFVAATALLTAFTLAVVRVLRTGARVACRCFGTSDEPLRPVHLVRNLLLLAAALAGLAAGLAHTPPPAPPAIAASAATGLFGALLVLLLDDAVHLFSPLQPRSATSHVRTRHRRRRPPVRPAPAEPAPHRRRDPAPEGAHRAHRHPARLRFPRTGHAPGR